MLLSVGGNLFRLSGPVKENECQFWHLYNLCSLPSKAKSWTTLVDNDSLNQDGEVEITPSSVDGVHHGAQLELYIVVNQKQDPKITDNGQRSDSYVKIDEIGKTRTFARQVLSWKHSLNRESRGIALV